MFTKREKGDKEGLGVGAGDISGAYDGEYDAIDDVKLKTMIPSTIVIAVTNIEVTKDVK